MTDNRNTRETVVVERRGGGGGLLIGLAVLVLVAVVAYFLIMRGDSETAKNNAIAGAAQSVESTADKAGAAVDKATN